ncbi:hypothetical protein HOLleu_04685 [Holothuria leucospilota]|uniref:Uncharacterized protein n=1 Tax=Holothuria leucospilota TaxID=206669 RepID=A0A9Q1CU42_HOLLE|nr:hypothetical protein HOLleu_04685 [Holothuria leucospilota]
MKNKGTYEQVKENDRQRKKAKRRSLPHGALKALRRAQCDSQRKHRMKIKGIGSPSANVASPVSFRSAQSLGKSVKRAANTLPTSPRKRNKVIRSLVKRYGVETDIDLNCSSRGGSNKILEETGQAVEQFYCRDDITWQSPNRKDKVKITNEDGSVTDAQKRFMVMTLKECHSLFVTEKPDKYVSLSKFCSLRPVHVFLSQDFPHTVCICRYHENVRLLLEGLHKSVSMEIPTHFHDFISTVVCNQENEACMFGECKDCANKFEEVLSYPEKMALEMTWVQWKTDDGRAKKVQQSGPVETCINLLKDQLPAFFRHTFIKRKQSQHFEAEKARADDHYAVVQVDFAENFAIIHQNEIQSAHWSHDQVTIFTACANVGNDDVKSYAIVSDDLVHGKYAVATFLARIVEDLQAAYPELQVISFFSDGAASQFKNRFLFQNLTHMKEAYNLESIKWNFFATSHGKGVVDGIGGQVKRLVFNALKTGAFVEDAQTFAAEASKHVTKIKVMFVPAQEIEGGKEHINAIWNGVKALPGTQGIHTVVVVNKHVVRYAPYAASVTYQTYALTDEGLELAPADIGQQPSLSSSHRDSEPQPLPPNEPSGSKIPTAKCGDFVLVEYITKNKVAKPVRYVAQIINMEGNEVQVVHYYKRDTVGCVFIIKERTDNYGAVSRSQIIKILPTPNADNKERFHFIQAIPEAS